MNKEEIIKQVSNELGMGDSKGFFINRQILADKINELLNTDFQKLVSILYRVDVSETKLKLLLKDNPGTDAGLIIADLMIERQEQKIKSRQQFNKRDKNMSDDEKW